MTALATHADGRSRPVPLSQLRLLDGAPAPSLTAHDRRHGPVPWRGGAGLLVHQVREAGLTGRGGAGFPTWRKMATAHAAGTRHRRPVVVANVAEGEPASAKDATLLSRAPHLVLDGLQLAAEAVGARTVFCYIKAGRTAEDVRRALAERRACGRDRHPVRLHEAPDTFIAGEESAVVAALEGGPALPRFKRRLLVEAGYRGRPTLVQNAETLAHLALLARHGASWFCRVGTLDEPGTFLATVSGAVNAPGVVESPYGTHLGDILALAGGPSAPLQAMLVGGYHGGWVPAGAAATLPVSRAALSAYGAAPGAGVVLALTADVCGLRATGRIATYLAGQSAGQCGPCLHGLPHLATVLSRLASARTGHGAERDMDAMLALVDGRGACRHPDGTARLVRSALHTFAADVEAHVHGHCNAEEA